MKIRDIMQAAGGGVTALAPIAVSTMPNAARALLMQRRAAIMAEQAAHLSRMCGDAIAIALGQQADVTMENIGQLLHYAEGIHRIGNVICTLPGNITVDDLAEAYRRE